jgi:uncharacterized protein YbjQ (UPF0145 family)
MPEVKCDSCGKTIEYGGFWSLPEKAAIVKINEKVYCKRCAQQFVDEAVSRVIMTTTPNIDGYVVKRYIDIDSVEIVIGTGVFSEFSGSVADFLGERSTMFEKKLQTAKQLALKKLKFDAFNKGGNAVIGIDLDYTEFSHNRIGLIANGTIVEVEEMNRTLDREK